MKFYKLGIIGLVMAATLLTSSQVNAETSTPIQNAQKIVAGDPRLDRDTFGDTVVYRLKNESSDP